MTDHPNAPAPEEAANLPAKAPTAAEKQRVRMDKVLDAVDARGDMLRKLLAGTGITFERFTEVIRRALIRNPDLIAADGGSLIEACINAATDGLLPDGRQGAIVIYNVKVSKRREPDKWAQRANWQPMYQGLLDIAYSSGNFRSIECRVVYEGDAFEYDLGDEPFIKHRPKTRPAGVETPAIVAAYAVAKTVNGGVFREVFEGADIAKVNAVSRATNGPMKNWPEEAARKGPLRRMWKFLPKNEAMNRIAERDNEGFDLDAMEAPAAQVERKLSPGFAAPPAALTQSADPVMEPVNMDGELVPAEPERGVQEGPATQMASSGERAFREPEESQSSSGEVPAVVALREALTASSSWLNIKQALRTFAKTETGADDRSDRVAKIMAWGRMDELREEGKDKTDFISDPLLFECWLLGSEPEPEPDAVEGNWAIVQADKAFEKLADEDKARLTARVVDAMRSDDGS